MRTVKLIDQEIDALHAELIATAGPFNELSARDWQVAWDAHPDMWQRDRALYRERYDAWEAEYKTAARQARTIARRTRKAA